MYISSLEWDDYRIDNVARQNIEPDEVWDVCEDSIHLAHLQGSNRYLVYGQTEAGRYLFVVLDHIEGTIYKPVTAKEYDRPRKT